MIQRRLISCPTCPRCGSGLLIYSDYLACERIDCGKLLSPTAIGLAEYSVNDLRKMFPGRCSVAPADVMTR